MNGRPTRPGAASMLFLALPFFASPCLAVEPGVDVAAPRVAVTTVDGSTFAFHPASLVVEQGDWVRWSWTGGSHTTTSGSGCLASGLWSVSLNSLSPPTFTRQFLEAPGAIPFFCSPHCLSFGMVGSVSVTTLIGLSANDAGGVSTLTWTGGSGRYIVYRAGAPTLVGATPLSPDGGNTGTTFTDATDPPTGQASFYLVMNLF
jgi:plastocyanin